MPPRLDQMGAECDRRATRAMDIVSVNAAVNLAAAVTAMIRLELAGSRTESGTGIEILVEIG